MNIRTMVPEDADAVARIEEIVSTEPWSKRSFLESISEVNDIYLVAEENGEILGYAGLWSVLEEGQITNVAVSPDYRRKGIARQLLNELLKRGRERGLTDFTLEARTSNLPAINLYHSLGFRDAGIRKDFYAKPREDAVIMWLFWGEFPLGK